MLAKSAFIAITTLAALALSGVSATPAQLRALSTTHQASVRVTPTRWARDAAMKPSMSPSRTPEVSEVS